MINHYTADHMRILNLVDPSIRNLSDGSYVGNSSKGINCFQKQEQLLPNVRAGDIVVLRDVKVIRIFLTLWITD